MIRFLMILARVVGFTAVILSLCQSALGRTQTRLLTAAQSRGWVPENEEASARLAKRQFNLFMWKMAREVERKKKRGEPVFETVKESEKKEI